MSPEHFPLDNYLSRLQAAADRTSAYLHIFVDAPVHSHAKTAQFRETRGWSDDLYVIGTQTQMGDPICIDFSEPGNPVSLHWHNLPEAGAFLAASPDDFAGYIEDIADYGAGEAAQAYPEDIRDHITAMITEDSCADEDTWMALVAPLLQSAEEREFKLIQKIGALAAEGRKIGEIAKALQLPIKVVYRLSKK